MKKIIPTTTAELELALAWSTAIDRSEQDEKPDLAKKNDPEIERFVNEEILPIFDEAAYNLLVARITHDVVAHKAAAAATAVHSYIVELLQKMVAAGESLESLMPDGGLAYANRGEGDALLALADVLTPDVKDRLGKLDV